jgi:hypothetical protein
VHGRQKQHGLGAWGEGCEEGCIFEVQLTDDKSRLHSQLECLLEEMRIKLSSVVSDLRG